jgi:hypothetical protein
MDNTNDNVNKDERALEALLAAAFRLDFPEKLSDEQAEKFFQQPAHLSKEDKEAIASWGTDLIEKLIEGQKTTSDKHPQDIIVNEELEQESFAMNRDKDGNDLDEETRRKIEEERKKALEEEENKDNRQNNES